MSLLRLMYHRPWPAAGIIAVGVAAIQLIVDWITWIELNEAIVYPLPLVLAAMARSRRLLWVLTVLLLGTIFAVYTLQIGPARFSPSEPFFINRVLAAITVLITAGLLHVWTLALDRLDEQDRRLKEQNEQLDAANRELQHYYDEITRQNEELDRRRQAAEEASGRKTQLLASVSHDMRSPLAAITLMANVIRRTADDPELAAAVPGLAQRLQANALALGDLISDVLDISSLESGRVELHESEFALNDVLDEACRHLLPLAQAKNLTLATEHVNPTWRMRTDRVKLARVLGNLVSNAIKFTEGGGVTLTAAVTAEEGLAIRVHDTGIGIPAESLQHIFDEFSQVRNGRHDAAKGWGLGLAISRRLVELMGGQLVVASERGRGSVFSVRLPRTRLVSEAHAGRGEVGDRMIAQPATPPTACMAFQSRR